MIVVFTGVELRRIRFKREKWKIYLLQKSPKSLKYKQNVWKIRENHVSNSQFHVVMVGNKDKQK
jgi:hypothetical protein